MTDYPVIDIHVHIQPLEMLTPETRRVFGAHHANFSEVLETVADPVKLLKYLDRVGVEKIVMINYTAPDVMGFTGATHEWAVRFVRNAPDRLLPSGSVHPRFVQNCGAEVDRLVEMGIRMLKVHPPHQYLYPNQYRDDLPQQAQIYERAQALGIPVMFHTGTSIFPKARNKYANPLFIDDLLVDFPDLKIILAHGGRPLWMDESFFLLRRSQNVFLDISGIPPQNLLDYFPRIEQICNQTMFGSDWPGPVVKDIGANIERFRELPISEETQKRILRDTALRVFNFTKSTKVIQYQI